MKIGIIGAGWIADKMGETLTGLDPSMKYAIAARDLGRAQEFARHWGFEKAYGSYKEMVEALMWTWFMWLRPTPTILSMPAWP